MLIRIGWVIIWVWEKEKKKGGSWSDQRQVVKILREA